MTDRGSFQRETKENKCRTNKREIGWEKLVAVKERISRREINGEEGEEEEEMEMEEEVEEERGKSGKGLEWTAWPWLGMGR